VVRVVESDAPRPPRLRRARGTLFLVPDAWQDWVLTPSELVVPVPDDVPVAVTAQPMINPLIAGPSLPRRVGWRGGCC